MVPGELSGRLKFLGHCTRGDVPVGVLCGEPETWHPSPKNKTKFPTSKRLVNTVRGSSLPGPDRLPSCKAVQIGESAMVDGCDYCDGGLVGEISMLTGFDRGSVLLTILVVLISVSLAAILAAGTLFPLNKSKAK